MCVWDTREHAHCVVSADVRSHDAAVVGLALNVPVAMETRLAVASKPAVRVRADRVLGAPVRLLALVVVSTLQLHSAGTSHTGQEARPTFACGQNRERSCFSSRHKSVVFKCSRFPETRRPISAQLTGNVAPSVHQAVAVAAARVLVADVLADDRQTSALDPLAPSAVAPVGAGRVDAFLHPLAPPPVLTLVDV